MATTLSVLGQLDTNTPGANTAGDIVSAIAASTSAVVSTITVANRSSTAATFRIWVVKSGATDPTNSQYLAYDTSINGNETIAYTLGVTLATGDKIRGQGSTTTISFNAFGQTIT